MAMGLKGKNKHYQWHTIQLRHWFSMAEQCRFPEQEMEAIIDEVFVEMDNPRKRSWFTIPGATS